MNTEVTQLRLVKATLTNEVEEYRTLAERRRGDIEALNVDCKRLTEQLAEANAAKCEALVRSEDIAAKEIGKISDNEFFTHSDVHTTHTANSAHFAQFLGKWAKLSVLFSW